MPSADPRPTPAADVVLADVAALLSVSLPPAAADFRVSGVSLDSRRVSPGDLYAALPGAHTHGARHAATADAAGAAAVLTDPVGAALLAGSPQPLTAPVLVVDDPRARLGAVAALVYGAPAEHLQLVGVTGTNGKTTVTTMVEQALTALGQRVGLVGTVCTKVAGTVLASSRTTPEAPELHALLALMRERDVSVAALEVSSHALALHRVDGVVFDVAVFTNLSQDHLDFHPTMEDYFAAKASLFTPERCRRAVVCVDDAWGRRLADLARQAGVPTTTLRVGGAGTDAAGAAGAADWSVEPGSIRARRDGGPGEEFVLVGPGGPLGGHTTSVSAASPMPGRFNTVNTALSLIILDALGVGLPAAAQALAATPGVPGRMQVVGLPADAAATTAFVPASPDHLPRAVVDYAHTPDAVAVALAALRPTTSGDLVVVLGAGGDRDASKRTAMGREAARGADIVVVTDDNPRSEDPAAIRAAVLAGAVGGSARVIEVDDRARAIGDALALAARRPGSTVLVAGKGHERGQEVAGVVHDFDDAAVVRRALADLTWVGSSR